MNIKLLIVQSHAHVYRALGKQAKGKRNLENHCLKNKYIFFSQSKIIFYEVNSNMHSDFRFLFRSLLGIALIYILDFHLPVKNQSGLWYF